MKVPENDPKKLISSLSDEILRTQSFRGKWCAIGSKLADLQSLFCGFSESPSISSNPLSSELLRLLTASLSDAVALAGKCRHTPELAGGKLKTQSDIDAVAAKLDSLSRDAKILLASGVLRDCAAVSTSNREAVRVSSRSLITRLQIGCQGSRNSAMESLLRLLREDDKNVVIAVAQGAVPVLVRLLDSTSCAEMKEQAVAAIAQVSAVDSSKRALADEGLFLLNHLLRVLESGSGHAKERACVALRSLTSASKENAIAVGSRGGISALLETCRFGTPGSQAVAAGVLRNLARHREIKDNFTEEHAISVLVRLSASGVALAQEHAIGCLCNLGSHDDVNLKLLIAREGAIDSLKRFWDGSGSVWDNRSHQHQVAADLIQNLASCSTIAQLLVSNGFMARLVEVLNFGVPGVRVSAAKAIHQLALSAGSSTVHSGCVVPLIAMLDGKAIEEQEAASKALSSVLTHLPNRRVFERDEKGTVCAVQLLDPSIQSLDKRYPVSVLASVVHSRRCRKQMAAAGAPAHLQKLVAMNVEGARKLLRRLGGGGSAWTVFAKH